MAAAWKKSLTVMSRSPRSAAAAAAPSPRQAFLTGGGDLVRTPRGGDLVRTPRGYVPMVLVGGEHEERVMVRVEKLKEPRMAAVLEMAAQDFGYAQPGVLRIPCAVDRFQQMIGAPSEAS